MPERSSVWAKVADFFEIKNVCSLIPLCFIVAAVYALWAVQPGACDDWAHYSASFNIPPVPFSGQSLRYSYGHAFFVFTPISLFKPASLIAAAVLGVMLWKLFSKEGLFLRSFLTMITLLGFPYLGHVGAWNLVASEYFTSVIWMMVWFKFLKIARDETVNFKLSGAWLLIITFIASCWFEVWLISFAAVTVFLFYDSYNRQRQKQESDSVKRAWIISVLVLVGYSLALLYYTRGGAEHFIDGKVGAGLFQSLMNFKAVQKALVLGTKECLVLFKDWIPAALLIVYAKLNKKFHCAFKADFGLFLSFVFGMILFMYVCTFITGAPQWRARWVCLLPLTMAMYALPIQYLLYVVEKFKLTKKLELVRSVCLAAAVVCFSFNAYYTYYYNNIDVIGWLRFREKVIQGSGEIEETCCRGFVRGVPGRAVQWNSIPWGAQDNRYRYLLGPSYATRKRVVAEWLEKNQGRN